MSLFVGQLETKLVFFLLYVDTCTYLQNKKYPLYIYTYTSFMVFILYTKSKSSSFTLGVAIFLRPTLRMWEKYTVTEYNIYHIVYL